MYVKDLDINVVDATERRILEAFNKNQKVAVSFSGGNTPQFRMLNPIAGSMNIKIVTARTMIVSIFFFLFISIWYMLLSRINITQKYEKAGYDGGDLLSFLNNPL